MKRRRDALSGGAGGSLQALLKAEAPSAPSFAGDGLEDAVTQFALTGFKFCNASAHPGVGGV